MRTSHPLPPELRTRPFTRAEALSSGISGQRLRRRDIERLSRGLYRWRGAGDGAGSGEGAAAGAEAGGADAGVGRSGLDEALLSALTSRSSELWVSHLTAARLWGAPLPARCRYDRRLHLSGPNRTHDLPTSPSWSGVVQHFPEIGRGEVVERCGIRLSAPHRLFIDLMAELTAPELVCVGDWLLRHPYLNREDREEPYCTPDQLKRAVRRHPWTAGVVTAREALEQVRIGSDSAPETLLRLAIVEAGLPEPELQVPCVPGRPGTAVGDMGYPEARIIIQYEGEHHFSAEQQAHDQWRNAEFEAEGWTVILVNKVDLADDFRRVVLRLSRLLTQHPHHHPFS